MNKKSIFSIIIISTFLYSSTFGAVDTSGGLECEYAGVYEQCSIAQKNGNSRSMKDPICTSIPSPESILDQIILDITFKEVDEELIKYLVQLETDKDKYFGPNAEEPELRAIDDVTKNLSNEGVYYKQYMELCNGGILAERMTCTKDKVPNQTAAIRINQEFQTSACRNLVEFKLDMYRNVAYDTLKLNKKQVQVDSHKEYVQKERTKYDALLSSMGTIVGHIGRLARGVTHWTPNPLQSSIIQKISNILS